MLYPHTLVCVKVWGAVNKIPLYGGVAEGRGGHDITRLLFFFNTIPPPYCTHAFLASWHPLWYNRDYPVGAFSITVS
jgi:hypothetical protein